MAVLSIVMGIGYVNLTRWVKTNQIREVAGVVRTDLERLRSGAWKNSVSNTLTLGAGGTSYTLNINGASTVVTLPYKATLALDNSATTLTYTAPYGEYQATSRTLTVTVPGAPNSANLYIVGVTGKVIQ